MPDDTRTAAPPLPDLKTNGCWQTPQREIVKVSTVYNGNDVTAQVLYPVPDRTTVRHYTAAQVAGWTEPTDALWARYESAWGFR